MTLFIDTYMYLDTHRKKKRNGRGGAQRELLVQLHKKQSFYPLIYKDVFMGHISDYSAV
jgi:hypothetical protein